MTWTCLAQLWTQLPKCCVSFKKLNEQIVTLQGNIRVFCRLRPLSSKEEDELKDEDELDLFDDV